MGILGLDKNAKLEFAAAKFTMNNENANKIKEYSKNTINHAKNINSINKKSARGKWILIL